jgi:hypothetical protein
MDEKVERLKSSAEARTLAGNARRLGHEELAARATQRAFELKALEEGHTSPAQQAIATALYAYEERQSQLKGKTFRANRTRQMLDRHGYLEAAERMVLNRRPSTGFEVLEEAGLQDLSFESIIDRYPEEFSKAAVEASRARLGGRPLSVRPPRGLREAEGDEAETPPVLDAEFHALVEGFLQPDAWFRWVWLPRYRETVSEIGAALSGGGEQDLVDILWKRQDNSVSNAGLGMLKHELVESLREAFQEITIEIARDGSPANFDRLQAQLETWRDKRLIPNVPRLLLARAFAAIHPGLYHTTVDTESHNSVLKWFAEHSGFRIPRSTSWAIRAGALCSHLDRTGLLGSDPLVRNIFPWFVTDQLRGRVPGGVRPGHTPRSGSTMAHLPADLRVIRLRHNELQTALHGQLVKEFGWENVWTEYPTGMGGYADAIARDRDNRCHLYEIKVAKTATEVVRQAMGQLLEYGFHRGGLEPSALLAVGEPELDDGTGAFLARLRSEFGLNISYLQILIPDSDAPV